MAATSGAGAVNKSGPSCWRFVYSILFGATRVAYEQERKLHELIGYLFSNILINRSISLV
jgi:hypothetical protein